MFMKLLVTSLLAQMSDERGRHFLLGARKVHCRFLGNNLKILLCFLGCLQVLSVSWKFADTPKCSIYALQA